MPSCFSNTTITILPHLFCLHTTCLLQRYINSCLSIATSALVLHRLPSQSSWTYATGIVITLQRLFYSPYNTISIIAVLFPDNFLPQSCISAVPMTLLFLFYLHPYRHHYRNPCHLLWHYHCNSLLLHHHCTALIVLCLIPLPTWSSTIITPQRFCQLPYPSFWISDNCCSTSSTAVFDLPHLQLHHHNAHCHLFVISVYYNPFENLGIPSLLMIAPYLLPTISCSCISNVSLLMYGRSAPLCSPCSTTISLIYFFHSDLIFSLCAALLVMLLSTMPCFLHSI